MTGFLVSPAVTSNRLTDLIFINLRLMCCHHFVALLLIALSRGQGDIPRLDDMNSFLGEPFTMTCSEGISPFTWCV